MKNLISMISVLLLTGCATPVTTLKRGDDVVQCGGGTAGSLSGGLIGYTIQEGHDKDCVADYAARGYRIVTPRED